MSIGPMVEEMQKREAERQAEERARVKMMGMRKMKMQPTHGKRPEGLKDDDGNAKDEDATDARQEAGGVEG